MASGTGTPRTCQGWSEVEMSWIESHQNLAGHPKTLKLAALLGISVPQAIGHLHLLWWWALDYAEDGDITDGADTLNIICQWLDDKEVFKQALFDAKFLDRDLRIHNWPLYAGRLIVQRERQREVKRQGGLARAQTASRNQQGRYTSPATDHQNPTNHNQPKKNTGASQTQPVQLPEWFNPLTTLKGYQKGEHARAREAILAACESYELQPSAVIEEFAKYYPVGQARHGWKNPVQALVTTIDVQCKKMKGGNGGQRGSSEGTGPFAQYSGSQHEA